MLAHMYRIASHRLSWLFVGTLWLSACGVTDIQFRDFAISTSIRVFFQAIATSVQSAVVSGFGGG